MSTIGEWIKSSGLQGISGEMLSFMPMPQMAGRILGDELVVEKVNDNLREFLHESIVELPKSVENLFSGINGPRDMLPLEESARVNGWTRRKWPVVKGECELDLICLGDGGDHFLAFFDDRTPHEVYSRLITMKERILFLLNLYDAKGMIPQILIELIEHLDVDWAGIFVWDGVRRSWVLSGEEANPSEFTQESHRNPVEFGRRLSEARGGPFGHQFGGLAVQDGSHWWIPWPAETAEWEPLLSEAGFESLFAGVLLTGGNPAILLCLSRTPGGFARINRDVLETIWPVFLSLAERNRAVSGITKLYSRDPVTGLYAQSMISSIMKMEMKRSKRYRYPLSLISVRVSNMEEIKAKGGIEAVDETAQRISRQILKVMRNVDIGGRLGEETILLLLPHTPIEGAHIVSGRIRSDISDMSPFPGIPLAIEVKSMAIDNDYSAPEALFARLGYEWPEETSS
ncbi:MAG: GGDEF domain-containing protein [Thermovirgaceae bacterium]|nr:GGDEF domain-containing protein [Thermovirgaceae bacterium]